MPLDYGLLGGMAEGLKSGVAAYNQAKAQKKRDDEILMDRAAKERGLITEQDWKNKQYEMQKQEFEQNKKFKEQELDLRAKELSKKGLIDPLDRKLKEAQLEKAQKEASVAGAPKKDPVEARAEKDTVVRASDIKANLKEMKDIIAKKGTFEALGPSSERMNSLIYQTAIAYAKLVDPSSVAREGEVAAAQKYMLPVKGLMVSNKTAQTLIDKMEGDVDRAVSTRSGVYNTNTNTSNVGMSPQDLEAVAWAKANPTDTRAKQIIETLGVSNGIAR